MPLQVEEINNVNPFWWVKITPIRVAVAADGSLN